MVTILMVYASGVPKILDVTLNSLFTYNAGIPYLLKILIDKKDINALIEVNRWKEYVETISLDVDYPLSGSGQHSHILDKALLDVKTEYFLTLDSDCFPVKDGWLKSLMELQNKKVKVSGILWPWEPPSQNLNHQSFEYDIMSFHNWTNTQPACQLINTQWMRDYGFKFADKDGRDTNHGFMMKMKKAGYEVAGFKVTRGPNLDVNFDPELPRHESLIFGDMIYHHVGASRDGGNNSGLCDTTRKRVYNEKGAAWMLESGNSYKFKFDKEHEVTAFKMKMFYQEVLKHLQNNSCVYSPHWC